MKLLAVPLAVLLCGCSSVGVLLGLKPFDPNKRNPQLDRLAQEVMSPPQRSVDELMAQGDRMRDSGDVGQAALAYLRAMRLDPTRHAAGERIGFLHLSQDDSEHAEAVFETVLKKSPDSAPALAGRGLAQLRKGEMAEARVSLQRAMEIDPRSDLAPLAMGLLCDWTDQPEEARRYYALVIELSPVMTEAENNMGVSYFLSGDYKQAEQHLRRAVELDPKDPTQHNNLALTLGELGRFDEALMAFRVAGNEAIAQNNIGYLYYRHGDYAMAIQHYERALSAAPADPLPIIRNLRRAQDDLDGSRAPGGPLAPGAAPAPAP